MKNSNIKYFIKEKKALFNNCLVKGCFIDAHSGGLMYPLKRLPKIESQKCHKTQ